MLDVWFSNEKPFPKVTLPFTVFSSWELPLNPFQFGADFYAFDSLGLVFAEHQQSALEGQQPSLQELCYLAIAELAPPVLLMWHWACAACAALPAFTVFKIPGLLLFCRPWDLCLCSALYLNCTVSCFPLPYYPWLIFAPLLKYPFFQEALHYPSNKVWLLVTFSLVACTLWQLCLNVFD